MWPGALVSHAVRAALPEDLSGIVIELTEHELGVYGGVEGAGERRAEGDPFVREDRDFVDAVAGGENRIRAPYGEALVTHRLVQAVGRSAREGRPVRLENADV